MHIRTPSFVNIPAIGAMIEGQHLADLPIIQASVAPVALVQTGKTARGATLSPRPDSYMLSLPGSRDAGSSRAANTLSTRRPSISRTSKRQPAELEVVAGRGNPAKLRHHEAAERLVIAPVFIRQLTKIQYLFNSSTASMPSNSQEPSSRRTTPGSCDVLASDRSPTMASITSLSVANPAMPPYSSTTSAMWMPGLLELFEQLQGRGASRDEHRREQVGPQVKRLPRQAAYQQVLGVTIPVTLSRPPAADRES